MLGRSPTTDFIYQRKLMCGYRRPKNLSQYLIRANIPFKEGDEYARPDYVQPEHRNEAKEATAVAEAPEDNQPKGNKAPGKVLKQTSIRKFIIYCKKP
jgi:hypothetical protein